MRKLSRAVPSLLLLLMLLAFTGVAAAASEEPLHREIKITAKKNAFEPNKITLRKGERVRLIVTSVDADCGVAIGELGVHLKVRKDATETVEFSTDKEGKFTLTGSVGGDERPDSTSELTGELLVLDEAPKASPSVQVSFDPDEPGVAFVEVNGERLRIDTNAKIYARVDTPAPVKAQPDSQQTPASTGNEQQTYRASEPYDYQLVNVPTPKRVPKGSFNVHFTHRFSSTITGQGQDFGDVASELFGLDSLSVSSLGFTYGFTDRLYGKILRSPVCDSTALCKTIEMGLGFHLLDEGGRSPVAMSVYGSVEGNDNFSDSFSYNVQAMVARSITEHVNVFFAPAVHFKTNGYGRFNPRAGRFLNDAELVRDFRLGEHTGSFGFGINGRVTKSTSLLFEYVPRTGFKLGRVEPVFDNTFNLIGFDNRSFPAIGFGIEKRLGRHAFSLTFSNTQTTTTGRYNSSNLGLPRDRFVIGFNLFRRLR